MFLLLLFLSSVLLSHSQSASGGFSIDVTDKEELCDEYVENTCRMTRDLSTVVDINIVVNGQYSVEDITWLRRIHIYNDDKLYLVPLLEEGKPPENMYLSNNRTHLVILYLRDYDVHSNSFKVSVTHQDNVAEIVFVINIKPI
ncbi:uncharacterized protein LOC102808454, partial [Saccoglossus kowalevskii]|uniref:Uncharacterized protein LOC102808454 n=1 Tax=Saccoglossus kowalevskii TaxID=10224 RepID=A0ABM0MCA8_SACKO